MKKICIVGMGNMGHSIYDNLNGRGKFEVLGCDKSDDLNVCLESCDIFFVAVKPQNFEELASSLKIDLSGKIAISIMAGISLERLEHGLSSKKVVRVMPNLPLKYGAAVSGWIANSDVSKEDKTLVREILESFGVELEVDSERKIDAITALSGSGPAYYYYLNRSLKLKALELGFSDEEAQKLVKGTFLGAAKMLEEGNECSGKLIDRIASKGGTTEAALNYLDSNGTDKLIGEAVEAAFQRAKELNT